MQDLTELPYFRLAPALYEAEVRLLRQEAQAADWAARYRAVLDFAATQPTWAFFGSAQDSALRSDVLDVLSALYKLLVQNGESACNGYHPWGYLWHFSHNFAAEMRAQRSSSQLFLFPGDWGEEFTGTRPEEVCDSRSLTPPHLSQTVRGPSMFMIGRRGAIFAPFGRGGKSELAQHRELMQVARWTTTPFTGWDVDQLPKRFLVDSAMKDGWFFDTEIAETASMTALPSLYPHDFVREQEVIVRVTGREKTNDSVNPHVYEFACAIDAAAFIFRNGV